MLAPNAVLQNRYLIRRSIGQGGMGAVYEALDQRFDGIVAVKETLHTDEQARKAFEREARLLYGLRHPSLPRVIDHFIEDDGQFLVMDYIPGDDLEKLRQLAGGKFETAKVLSWADRLLEALEYLHGQQPPIIHRDIKPQNLKLTPAGEIILLDFGLAKGSTAQSSQNTTGSSIVGYTPNYAPLEQIRGAGTDARSDVFSLAATMYILLTGTIPPDVITRVAEVHAGLADPLKPANQLNPEVPPAIASVLSTAMTINREHRLQSAAIMRKQLRDANNLVVSTNTEAATVYVQTPSGRRTPVPAANAPITPKTPVTAPLPPPQAATPGPQPGAAVAQSPAVAKTDAIKKPVEGPVFSRAPVVAPATAQTSAPAVSPTSQRNQTSSSVRGDFPSQRPVTVRPVEQKKSKVGLVIVGLLILGIIAAGLAFYLVQPGPDSATKEQQTIDASNNPDASGTVFQTMSPSQHLAAAKQLLAGGASAAQLGKARDHLNAIPESSPEYKDAQPLIQELESRMKGNGPQKGGR
ncbi:MAG TPA: protein kinase [Blastocatellia bacterium]|nr:protein kinase [Blastocatellia bacterium]